MAQRRIRAHDRDSAIKLMVRSFSVFRLLPHTVFGDEYVFHFDKTLDAPRRIKVTAQILRNALQTKYSI